MAYREAVFLDGPRKGNNLKIPAGKTNEFILTTELKIAAKKEGGEMGIAIYAKEKKITPAGHPTSSNEYRFVKWADQEDEGSQDPVSNDTRAGKGHV